MKVKQFNLEVLDSNKNLKFNESTNKYEVINPEAKYLSDIMDSLPKNCIFVKGKCTAGGTSLAIKSDEKYLILVPTINIVKSKEMKENGAFVYQGNYDQINSMDYNGKTIMATYESLPKIMKLIHTKEWNLLIDEYDELGNRIEFYEFLRMNFTAFKSFCFMSATKHTVDLPFLNVLKCVTLEWGKSLDLDVYYGSYQNDLFSAKIQGNSYKNIYVFVNSVTLIEAIMNHYQLKAEDVRTIFSPNYDLSKTSLKRNTVEDPQTKYTFLTSTDFRGVDIEDTNVECLIYMDENKPFTLLGLEDVEQCCGRFRKIDVKPTIFINKRRKEIKKEYNDAELRREEKIIPALKAIKEVYGEAFNSKDYPYRYVNYNNMTINYSQFRMDVDESKIKSYENIKKHAKNYPVSYNKTDKRINFVTLVNELDNHPNHKYYTELKDAISKIGLENVKLCKTIKQVRQKAVNPEFCNTRQIQSILKYTVGEFYPCKRVKKDFESLGFFYPATKIKCFYDVEEKVVRNGADLVKGFIIKSKI